MSDEDISEYVFTWRIKNYSSCYQGKNECIKSPSFTVENIPQSEWCLWLYPKGHNRLEDSENFISLILEWKSLNGNAKVIVSYSTEIVDEKNLVLECVESNNREFNRQDGLWARYKFFAAHELDEKINNSEEDVLILRCRMKIDNKPTLKLSESLACTTIEVDRCSVEWCVEMTTIYEYSEKISFEIFKLHDLNITLKSTEDKMAILIHFKDKYQSSQQLTFTFTLFDKRGCKFGSKRAGHLCKHDETWNFPVFITKEWLKCCQVNSYQYEFKLMCEVKISKKSMSSCFDERLKFVSPCSLKSIQKDIAISAMQSNFRKLYMNETYSDVTIRCKTGDFTAHKLVLKVQSPVFAAMFDQDMLENKTGIVNITDIDGKILKAFLEFLYTETVNEMDYEMAKNLMLVGDKYQVPSLVDECASFLKNSLSTENVCEVIAMADMIGCEILKYCALNLIRDKASEILLTSAWTDWIEENIKLATYILSELSATIGTNHKLI